MIICFVLILLLKLVYSCVMRFESWDLMFIVIRVDKVLVVDIVFWILLCVILICEKFFLFELFLKIRRVVKVILLKRLREIS